MIRVVLRFVSLSAPERASLLEAVFWLGAARLAIAILPFRFVASALGTYMLETLREPLSETQMQMAHRIRHSICAAAHHVPWQAACLSRSIAAKKMLARHHIPATLYLGVARERRIGVLRAHAWVRAGQLEVTHAGREVEFSITALFG
jgi:hypothetical protein